MINRKLYKLKAGDISRLKIHDEPCPKPTAGELTIEVKSIGLNFADIFAIMGLYSATPKGEFTPGLEYSGIVAEVGKEVRDYKVGDRVMGVTRFGAYTSHLNIGSNYVIPLAEDWTFEEGAAFLVQVLTAYYGLVELGNLQPHQTVLVHSAAGGVGIWANRIVQAFNGFTIGTVGNASKIDFAKNEGYNKIIVRSKGFKADLEKALNDRDLNIVMECIGGKILESGFDLMAPMGRMIVYGSARYGRVGDKPNYFHLLRKYITRPKIDPQEMTNLNKSVMAFNLIWLFEHSEMIQKIMEAIVPLKLGKPIIGQRFDFEELPKAIRLFQTGNTSGKLVVNV